MAGVRMSLAWCGRGRGWAPKVASPSCSMTGAVLPRSAEAETCRSATGCMIPPQLCVFSRQEDNHHHSSAPLWLRGIGWVRGS